jgi:hypothetical protein
MPEGVVTKNLVLFAAVEFAQPQSAGCPTIGSVQRGPEALHDCGGFETGEALDRTEPRSYRFWRYRPHGNQHIRPQRRAASQVMVAITIIRCIRSAGSPFGIGSKEAAYKNNLIDDEDAEAEPD